jgi:RNA polymerase sigma-70 factor (ECF subfamily)
MEITLIERLKKGEEPAFREIFHQFYPALVKFAHSYIHDPFTAENIVQDAFVTLWEKRVWLDNESNLKAFLVTIIKNKSINHIEKLKNRYRIEQNNYQLQLTEANLNISSLRSLNPEELFTGEIISILEKTIATLPLQTQEIFRMSRYQSLSNKEIAEKLKITEKGVEYHISKALKTLRTELSDYLPLLVFFLN